MAVPLRQLYERRTALVAQMRALADSDGDPAAGASDEEDGLTPEQHQAFGAMKEALAKLEASIAMRISMDDAERRVGGGVPVIEPGRGRELRVFASAASEQPAAFDGRVMTTQDGARVPLLEHRHRLAAFARPEERASDLTFGGFLRALYFGPRSEVERRQMGEATIGAGGALVPTPLAMLVIDLLRSEAVAFKAGAITVPMESQTLRFARQIADPVGSWRAENTPITEGEPAFDAVTLTAKSWALLVKISRELMEDGQNTDSVLQSVFAKVAALALDRAILYGSGAANTPLGIAATPGILNVSMGVNGGPLTSREALLDAQAALQMANVPDITAMVMSPRTARSFNGLTDTLGQPLRLPPSLEGIPQLTTTSASITETQGTSTAASSILLGDFGQVLVGMRTALQVSILQERFADQGQLAFVLWLRADVLLQHPAAICRIGGITPA